LGDASNPSGQFDAGSELLARIGVRPEGEVAAFGRVFGVLEEGARYDFDTSFGAGLEILVEDSEALAGRARRERVD
jgi:hypothetical protein